MRVLFAIVVLWVFAGCQDVVRPEKPEDLIPKDKMVQILVESYTGNAARSVRNRTLRDAGVALDSILYAKYDIDSLRFVRSNSYYASQINDYIEIMREVESILSAKKKNLDSVIQLDAKKLKDSLGQKREERKQDKDTLTDGLIQPAKQD